MHPARWIVAAAALVGALPAPGQGPAGDAVRAGEKVRMCRGCHGIDGWRTAFPEVYRVPRIGGQHATYLAAALQAYKAGSRSHPSMKAIAATLSDQDIADLAAYYAKSPPKGAAK